MRIRGLKFPLMIWLLILLTSPVIYLMLNKLILDRSLQDTESYIYAYSFLVGLGVIFSIPAFVLAILLFYFISERNIHILILKSIFILSSLLLVFLTFKIFFWKMELYRPNFFNHLWLAYSISTIIFPSVIQLSASPRKPEN